MKGMEEVFHALVITSLESATDEQLRAIYDKCRWEFTQRELEYPAALTVKEHSPLLVELKNVIDALRDEIRDVSSDVSNISYSDRDNTDLKAAIEEVIGRVEDGKDELKWEIRELRRSK